MPTPKTEKLQKILAAHGLGARRTMETWISEGLVTVNGEPATLGQRASSDDIIAVDGKTLPALTSKDEIEILMYHKPRGEVCTTSDPEERPTVFDHLPNPKSGRWVMVGRLDVNTSGLLLFTNNGEYANELMHPRYHIEREYMARIYGGMSDEVLTKLKEGVMLEDGEAKFDDITPVKKEGGRNQWYKVTICLGRNRIVRRLWASQDLKVNRLSRIRFGNLVLPDDLSEGEFQNVKQGDIIS